MAGVKAALVGFVALGLGAAPALAQSSACRPDDLRCRVDRLEAALAAIQAKQKAPPVYVPPRPPEQEIIHTYMQCRANCTAEAQKACSESGYARSEPKLVEHPRNGPVMLRSALCLRH